MYSHTSRPLITPREIVANPGDIPRESGIDSHHGNEDTSVNDAGDSAAG